MLAKHLNPSEEHKLQPFVSKVLDETSNLERDSGRYYVTILSGSNQAEMKISITCPIKFWH
jgi:hypothetical protein